MINYFVKKRGPFWPKMKKLENCWKLPENGAGNGRDKGNQSPSSFNMLVSGHSASQ